MRVSSVNISEIRTVKYNDKNIDTGIFKRPVNGVVQVGKLNIEGDNQADKKSHGGLDKAVYAFSTNHYSYWQKKLGIDFIAPGSFGENLTISDFDENILFVGDKLSIGGCILEISEPRVPCFKLGLAFNNMKMPGLFMSRFLTGAYMRVLREGKLQAGDKVSVIGKSEFKVTIKSFFRAFFDKEFLGTDSVLEQLVNIPNLSPSWKSVATKKLEKSAKAR